LSIDDDDSNHNLSILVPHFSFSIALFQI